MEGWKAFFRKGADAKEVITSAGYMLVMDSEDMNGPLNPFSIEVYKNNEDPAHWVVFVWDAFELLDEYHIDNTFDLATFVNTFCPPLA